VTSGGFEGENKYKAFGSSPEKGIFVISHLSANHDSLVRNTCTMENYFAIFVPPRSFNIFWTNSMSVWMIKNYMDL
jgi:hypothetical protein